MPEAIWRELFEEVEHLTVVYEEMKERLSGGAKRLRGGGFPQL
jgi:hypothetical protein